MTEETNTTFLQRTGGAMKRRKGMLATGGGVGLTTVLTLFLGPEFNEVRKAAQQVPALEKRLDDLEQTKRKQWESINELERRLDRAERHP